MNTRLVGFAGAVMCGLVCAGARADFLCASIELVEDDGPGGNWTWRCYLNFTDPGDELLGVGGIPDLAPLALVADGNLINDGGVFSGLKIEDFPSGAFGGSRDSWITIGDDLGFPSPTDYSPGFAGSDGIGNIIRGSGFEEDDGGWFNGDPATPVTGTHLLIAQFTLPSGDAFSLSGMAGWVDADTGELVVDYFDNPISGCDPPCVGDIDDSGDVGFTDLVAVLGAWGPCMGCPEDIDNDDDVGLTDLLAVLSRWGSCP